MIRVHDLSIHQGEFSLKSVEFLIPDGAYGVLMGRTGCGKTTILEAICGLRPVTQGKIFLSGHDVTRLKPAQRNIGYVPQDGALFQTMSVRDNLAFSLHARKESSDLVNERVEEMGSLLGITHLLDRPPKALSGGEAQRVSLGRALASHPHILCLDEPLSALDEETRDQMYSLLRSIQERTGVTVLHITHNPSEAVELADTVLRMEDGVVREVPLEQFRHHPTTNASPPPASTHSLDPHPSPTTPPGAQA
ncbi:MAG: ABC transporter ATP-binding protein [Planctomycetota bacterium]|jgi:ABC-type sugar transport system ATPase subunit